MVGWDGIINPNRESHQGINLLCGRPQLSNKFCLRRSARQYCVILFMWLSRVYQSILCLCRSEHTVTVASSPGPPSALQGCTREKKIGESGDEAIVTVTHTKKYIA